MKRIINEKRIMKMVDHKIMKHLHDDGIEYIRSEQDFEDSMTDSTETESFHYVDESSGLDSTSVDLTDLDLDDSELF